MGSNISLRETRSTKGGVVGCIFRVSSSFSAFYSTSTLGAMLFAGRRRSTISAPCPAVRKASGISVCGVSFFHLSTNETTCCCCCCFDANWLAFVNAFVSLSLETLICYQILELQRFQASPTFPAVENDTLAFFPGEISKTFPNISIRQIRFPLQYCNAKNISVCCSFSIHRFRSRRREATSKSKERGKVMC